MARNLLAIYRFLFEKTPFRVLVHIALRSLVKLLSILHKTTVIKKASTLE